MVAPPLELKKIGEIITGEDGLLKEAIKTGNLEEVLEIANSVSSVLNYMQRQDNLQGEKGNVTDANKEALKKSEDKRKEVCGGFLFSVHYNYCALMICLEDG